MENYLAVVDATFLIDDIKALSNSIGTHRFDTLVPKCVEASKWEAGLIGEAKRIIAAIHDVQPEHVCVTGINVRKVSVA